MANNSTTSLSTGTLTSPVSSVASSNNAEIKLDNLNVVVSGDDDIDTRLDRLEQFALAADREFGVIKPEVDGAVDLSRKATDEVATFDAKFQELGKGILELKPDELDARLSKIEGDNKLLLERPVIDPANFPVAELGAYTEPSDNFPRGLAAHIFETYHRSDVAAYNRDVAATAERKAREAAAESGS